MLQPGVVIGGGNPRPAQDPSIEARLDDGHLLGLLEDVRAVAVRQEDELLVGAAMPALPIVGEALDEGPGDEQVGGGEELLYLRKQGAAQEGLAVATVGHDGQAMCADLSREPCTGGGLLKGLSPQDAESLNVLRGEAVGELLGGHEVSALVGMGFWVEASWAAQGTPLHPDRRAPARTIDA